MLDQRDFAGDFAGYWSIGEDRIEAVADAAWPHKVKIPQGSLAHIRPYIAEQFGRTGIYSGPIENHRFTYYVNDRKRWIYRDGGVCFKDPADAILFKLRLTTLLAEVA